MISGLHSNKEKGNWPESELDNSEEAEVKTWYEVGPREQGILWNKVGLLMREVMEF